MNTTINIYQEVKDKFPIEQGIGEVVPLDKNLQGICPFHDDKNPSFTVYPDSQTFHCFGCGAHGDIFDFYEKYFNITKGEALKKLAEKAGISLDNNDKPKLVCTYEYQDENGNVLYYIDRLLKANGEKTFRAWRFENGEKVYNLDGVRLVPYRLPNLLKGPDLVLIVEGEKDVETAMSLGFTATTNPFGAGKWRDEYSVCLKGGNYILIPDSDTPGREHMKMVADSLLKNGAKSVKIINLPGLKEKEDLTDFVNKGGTREDILQLIEEADNLSIQKQDRVSQDNKSITLHEIVEDELKSIHPALDFNNTCYVTIPLLTKSVVDIDAKKGKKETDINKMYWVITSKKEMFTLTKDELLNRNFYFPGELYLSGSRWSWSKSISLWLKNDVDVSPVKVFSKVKGQFEYYLDLMDKRYYTYFSLWTIGTYFFPLFSAYPILFLNGGSGSGKTKTMIIISALAFNAINTVNISDPAIFRLVQGTRGTQLLDENERIADTENSLQMINLILAGFLKGAKAIRLEKEKRDKFIPVEYEVHCPKAIANIKGIDIGALLNRTVQFIMHPAKVEDPRAAYYPDPNDSKWQELRNDLYILLMNHWQEIKEVKKTISPVIDSKYTLSNYFFMQWEPVLTLAKYFSEKSGDDSIYGEMVTLAVEKMEERKKDKTETYENVLLRTILKMHNEPNIHAERIKEGKIFLSNDRIMAIYEEELESKPDWLNPTKMGWMLKKLHIGDNARINRNKTRGIWVRTHSLNEICQRHNITLEIPEEDIKEVSTVSTLQNVSTMSS